MVDPRFIPAFVSPLSDKDHARIGRIAVLWGQIDFILDELLLNVLNLTHDQRAMFIGEKPIGPKLDLIKPKIKAITNAAIQKKVQGFYNLLNDTKAQRNHLFHGCWGWRGIDRTKTVEVCVRHPKSLTNPVKIGDLPKLEKALCEASRLGMDALEILRDWPRSGAAIRFTHGVEEAIQPWFQQWRQQHPLDGDMLDHNWSEGELPRLSPPRD